MFTTNAAGAVPANVGTQDIGCVPAATVPCDFTKANNSRVLGSAAGGRLRWDPAVAPAAPAGYLGDGATPHTITGGTAGDDFAILDSNGNAIVDDAGAPLQSTPFTVVGKLAGSLTASPAPADFGGQNIGSAGAAKDHHRQEPGQDRGVHSCRWHHHRRRRRGHVRGADGPRASKSLHNKLGVRSQLEAVIKAQNLGLIGAPGEE